MKKIRYIFLLLNSIICTTNAQQNNSSQYAHTDFMKFISNVKGDTLGRIFGEVVYTGRNNRGNKLGSGTIYMLHKNGANWWHQRAKKIFPNKDVPENKRGYYAALDAKERLLKEDSTLLKHFNKWLFFIDKKDLSPEVSSSGENDISTTYYYPKYPHTIVLYEQKAGANQWIEVDRKIFSTEEEENKSTWKSDFIKQKLTESNENTLN